MLIDEEAYLEKGIDEFLEHHGVKGQKWGIRNRTSRIQGHLDRVNKVATGTASKGEKVRVGVQSFGGVRTKKGAQKVLNRAANAQKKVNAGKAKTLDFLLRVQGIKIKDLNYHQPK